MAKGKSSFFKKVLISILLIVVLGGGAASYMAYKLIYKTNVNLGDKKSQIIYIPTGSNFNDVMTELTEKNILLSTASF